MNILSPEAIQKAVATVLPNEPVQGNRAVVGTLDEHGAQVVASFKFHEGMWQLQAEARHDWGGTNEVGAKVLLQW